MTDAGRVAGRLDRECDVFCAYLAGARADDAVRAAYRRGHAAPGFAAGLRPTRFDGLLVRVAASAPAVARACDGYARVLRPTGLLRRKLVLLTAILECRASTSARFEDADGIGSPFAFALRFAAALVAHAARFAAAALVLLPAQAVLGLAPAPRPGAAAAKPSIER